MTTPWVLLEEKDRLVLGVAVSSVLLLLPKRERMEQKPNLFCPHALSTGLSDQHWLLPHQEIWASPQTHNKLITSHHKKQTLCSIPSLHSQWGISFQWTSSVVALCPCLQLPWLPEWEEHFQESEGTTGKGAEHRTTMWTTGRTCCLVASFPLPSASGLCTLASLRATSKKIQLLALQRSSQHGYI